MARPIDILRRWRIGERVTARMLNEMTEAINGNTAAIAAPRDRSESSSEIEYNETERETSEVQVFDQNEENYATIERIDSITLQNDAGDTLTLNFEN